MEKIKNKDNILYILIVVIISFVTSLSVYAATINYQSADVWYDNSTSHLTSSNVKGALDELHSTATNYTDITTRTNTLSSYFPATTISNRTIYPYTYEGANIGANGSSSQNSWIDLYYNGVARGSIYSSSATNGLAITAKNASGTSGSGTLSLTGNPIQINGNDFSFSTVIGTINNSTGEASSITTGGDFKTLATLTIPAGTWIIEAGGYFASNSTGVRAMYLVEDGQDPNDVNFTALDWTIASPNGVIKMCNIQNIVVLTSSKKFNLMGYQASGSSLNVSSRIYAIRIK